MEWLLKKGQDLAATSESHGRMTLRKHFWPGDERTARCDLLATDADKAPYRSKDKVSRSARYDVLEDKS
jgi:hypothetical protein